MKIKHWKTYLLFFLLTALILRSFLKSGVPHTHDGNSHLARIANIYLAVRERHFPIRWAKNLNYKFGYPVFNFNYYFPFLATIPFYLVFRSIENAWKLTVFLSTFGGGLFCFLWLKKHFKPWPAVIGAFFYLLLPYHLVNIFVRGVTGEIICFFLIPAIFWIVEVYFERKDSLALFFSSLLIFILCLSHNIVVMFFFPLLIIYVIFYWKVNKGSVKELFLNFLPIILGIMMSMFFWIPALMEKKYTNLDAVDISHFYRDHFPTIKQLINYNWGYGYSKPGPDDGMSFSVGPIHFILCLTASVLFLVKIKTKEKNKHKQMLVGFFVFLFWLTIFAMLRISGFFWDIVPFLHYVQFPWRLLLITGISSAVLIGWLAGKFSKAIFVILVVLQLLVYTLPRAKPKSMYSNPNFYYYEFPFTTSIKDENMPFWFVKGKSDQIDKMVRGVDSPIEFNQLKWNTGEHIYTIKSLKDSIIAEHTVYFPGWKVYVDGKEKNIDFKNKSYPGLITYSVGEGEHKVRTIFTEDTLPRRVGDNLTLAGLAGLAGILIFKKNEKRK